MLNLAAHEATDPFFDSLSNPLAVVYEAPIEAFALYVEDPGSPKLYSDAYPRYWHGYLLVLKPALVFFNLKEIRVILQSVFLLLFLAAVLSLSYRFKAIGVLAAVALAVTYGMFGVMDAAVNLPLFSSFAISLVGILWITWKKHLFVGASMSMFALLGALCSFFDFLDNPILTFAFPVAVLAIRFAHNFDVERPSQLGNMDLHTSSNRAVFRHDIKVVALCFAAAIGGWLIGYGGFWSLKWILATLVTGIDVVGAGVEQVGYRSGLDSAGPLDAICANLGVIGKGAKLIAFVAAAFSIMMIVGGMAMVILRKRDVDVQEIRDVLVFCALLGVISAAPYVWYAVVCQHSIVHCDFIAYRTQCVTLFCLLLGCMQEARILCRFRLQASDGNSV